MAIPVDVLMKRLRFRENVPLTRSTSRCNDTFQEFLALVLPDLGSDRPSSPREKNPSKQEKVRLAAEKAIKEIRSYGFELRKAEVIERTSELDIEDYKNQRHQIEESIKGVQEEIGALKEGLVGERKNRYNKEIYEEACKDINKYPPHRDTKMTIEKLQKELRVLDERKKAVKAVQSLKQKQIALILQSLADVQATVHEQGDAEEGPPTSGYALELMEQDQEEEIVTEGGEAGEGEGDNLDDVDDENDNDNDNANDDGEAEVEEEGRRRSRRKRLPSADSDDHERAIEAGGGGGGGGSLPQRGGEDEEMPDAS